MINPNKAGFFEGSFSWEGAGGQNDPPHPPPPTPPYFKN